MRNTRETAAEVARYAIAALIATAALLVAASVASLVGWTIEPEPRGWHRVADGAWVLVYAAGIGLAGIVIARLVARRSPWSWWLLLAFVFPIYVILDESGMLGGR